MQAAMRIMGQSTANLRRVIDGEPALDVVNGVDPAVVRVFYTTPGYFDYNWTVRADMKPALKKKITDAFLALDKSTAQGKEILELQRATKFIATKAANYGAIEAAAHSAGLLK